MSKMSNNSSGLTLRASMQFRLDDGKVLRYFHDQERLDLQKAGAYVRTVARRSMRRATQQQHLALKFGHMENLPARPGKPPLRWMDRRNGGGLYRQLVYAWDSQTQSVVVGPKWFGGFGIPAPGQVEAGGVTKMRNPRRRKRSLGGSGEIALGAGGKLAKDTLIGSQLVRYASLHTTRQVRRANELNERLYGPSHITIAAAAHPYMGPALKKSKHKIQEIIGAHA